MSDEKKLSKFAVVLSQLRRERGISQKKAATDLGISQALLSHYEKGIRECGLDFVIRCSKYYGVTTDYMLGVSDDRNGRGSDYFSVFDENDRNNVKMLSDATRYLLDSVSSYATDEEARRHLFDYYMLSLYRGSLTLAKAGVLPKEMFKLDYTIARDLASAAIAVQDAKFVLIEDKSRTGMDESLYTALHALIEQAEEHILTNYIL